MDEMYKPYGRVEKDGHGEWTAEGLEMRKVEFGMVEPRDNNVAIMKRRTSPCTRGIVTYKRSQSRAFRRSGSKSHKAGYARASPIDPNPWRNVSHHWPK